ncbi:ATP-binding protein [Neobacillus sp. PS3-40]|uniref:AlbA family DNA-binding domain-containing protein n=1 Tax=Neobacillus sp. PS3-40 TaxID=3070679 RepID=UPI0027DF30C7|nr:ATP-binding protein [Neobacillus sp. PS3-40]WML44991.1 ATP-binding protein [Neobacillus sp. PS3-40]
MLYEYVYPKSLQHFVKNPTHETLKELLLNNTGETDFLDFKTKWPYFSKVAKHILAIANSGGGCIIVGVSQNDEGAVSLSGLSEDDFLDKADIDNKLEHLLPKYLKYRVEDFQFIRDEHPSLKNKRFQVLLIEYDPKYVPYTSVVQRGEIRYGAIYMRQGTKSLEATNERLVEIILRKVQSGGSSMNDYSLKDHLSQLKELYDERQTNHQNDFGNFITELIERKKERIRKLLDILSEN